MDIDQQKAEILDTWDCEHNNYITFKRSDGKVDTGEYSKYSISSTLQFLRTILNYKNGEDIRLHQLQYYDYYKYQDYSYFKTTMREKYGYG